MRHSVRSQHVGLERACRGQQVDANKCQRGRNEVARTLEVVRDKTGRSLRRKGVHQQAQRNNREGACNGVEGLGQKRSGERGGQEQGAQACNPKSSRLLGAVEIGVRDGACTQRILRGLVDGCGVGRHVGIIYQYVLMWMIQQGKTALLVVERCAQVRC